MENQSKTTIEKDFVKKSITVSREFTAPVERVWRAFTERELLDQWWAPQPWKAETKKMDFSVGGYWLYSMVGPENEKHWARMDYTAIDAHKSFDANDAFCDENGTINNDLPVSEARNNFTKTNNGTLVEFKLSYPTEKDLQAMVDMGFEQGITACFEQLESLLKQNRI